MPINQINPGTAFHRSPNRIIAFLFGGVYVLVGLLGFFWVNGVPFAGPGDGPTRSSASSRSTRCTTSCTC